MAFDVNYTLEDGVAKVMLRGELDGSVAGMFKEAVEQAFAAQPRSIALIMSELEYMSSAGLRVLVFTRQKSGADTPVYLVGVQEEVMDSLRKTGLHLSFAVLESYDAALIGA